MTCGKGLLLLAGVGLLAMGCSDRGRCCPCPDGRPLDEALMLFLATARSLHHKADVLAGQGESAQAAAAVEAILELRLAGSWPEAEEVRLDAASRLAKMRLAQGRVTEALALVQRMRAGVKRESFYLANLLTVEGEILERQVQDATRAGQKPWAEARARQALAVYERAIAINKRLLDKLEKREVR